MKIKAYTSVNDYNNTHYYKEFEVVDSKPEGEWERIDVVETGRNPRHGQDGNLPSDDDKPYAKEAE